MVDNPWFRIYLAESVVEAQVLVSALQHNGIEARLKPADGSGFGAALPTLNPGPAVWVRRADLEAAREIVDNAADSAIGQVSVADSDGGTLHALDDDDPETSRGDGQKS